MKLRILYISMLLFFFFQAEDGIRDLTVTGVQTCALPISRPRPRARKAGVETIHAASLVRVHRDADADRPPPPAPSHGLGVVALRHHRREIGRASCRERV